MKYIKLFEYYSTIQSLCNKYNITSYDIKDNGKVDANQNVYIGTNDLVMIPIDFGIIYGNFDISSNRIVSLKGCPEKIEGSFYANFNKIESMEFSPKVIEGSFEITSNQLVSLVGMCPNVVNFYAAHNHITSLKGCANISGGFGINNNKIKKLDYFQEEFNGQIFQISDNPIKTLKGFPKFNNQYMRSISLAGTYLPSEIKTLEFYVLKEVIKNQEDYKIWNNDDTLNKARLNLLIEENIRL